MSPADLCNSPSGSCFIKHLDDRFFGVSCFLHLLSLSAAPKGTLGGNYSTQLWPNQGGKLNHVLSLGSLPLGLAFSGLNSLHLLHPLDPCETLLFPVLRYISRRHSKPPMSIGWQYSNFSEGSSGRRRRGLVKTRRPPGFSARAAER